MKIFIACPECNKVLTDKFSCEVVTVAFGKTSLGMECLCCNRYYDLSINIIPQQANAADECHDTECMKSAKHEQKYHNCGPGLQCFRR